MVVKADAAQGETDAVTRQTVVMRRQTDAMYGVPTMIAILVIGLMVAGCNLTSNPPRAELTPEPTIAVTFVLQDVETPTAPPDGTFVPTLIPLPGVVPPTTPLADGLCEVYTTYSGADADNTLSLRAQPSADAVQVFRVPNFAGVFRVPGSQEVEAEGYHWLNVIYVVDSARYEGWIARDSFQRNGVRQPEIATLRRSSEAAPCP
jgi:hypothetical protein